MITFDKKAMRQYEKALVEKMVAAGGKKRALRLELIAEQVGIDPSIDAFIVDELRDMEFRIQIGNSEKGVFHAQMAEHFNAVVYDVRSETFFLPESLFEKTGDNDIWLSGNTAGSFWDMKGFVPLVGPEVRTASWDNDEGGYCSVANPALVARFSHDLSEWVENHNEYRNGVTFGDFIEDVDRWLKSQGRMRGDIIPVIAGRHENGRTALYVIPTCRMKTVIENKTDFTSPLTRTVMAVGVKKLPKKADRETVNEIRDFIDKWLSSKGL